MKKKITHVFLFASDSDPNKTYETLKYNDGATSCNCRGWCQRVAADGSRSCRHTRLVDMDVGIAERHAITHTHYYDAKCQPLVNMRGEVVGYTGSFLESTAAKKFKRLPKKATPTPKIGARKLNL